MEVYNNRLRSYDKSISKSASNAAWPHPDSFAANPTSLAEAGFFHNPTEDDLDAVQCFLCKTELIGWDKHDNPFQFHVDQSPECPWAIARCSLEFDVDSDGNFSIQDEFRLPSNKILEKARLGTFGGKSRWWKHDSVKNHGATSKKMAKAGFVFTPQEKGDDAATCFYCNLALSGWEIDDDPIEQHRSRSEHAGDACPFFLSEVLSVPQSKPKAKAAATSKSRTKKKGLILDNEPRTKELQPPNQQSEIAKKEISIAPDRKRVTKPILIDADSVSDDDTEDYQPSAKARATSKSSKKASAIRPKKSLAAKKRRKFDLVSDGDDKETLDDDETHTRAPGRSGRETDETKSLKDMMKPKRKGKTKGKEKQDLSDSESLANKHKPSSLVDGKITKDALATSKIREPRREILEATQTKSKSKSTSISLRGSVASKSKSKSASRASRSQAVQAAKIDHNDGLDDDDGIDAGPTFDNLLSEHPSQPNKTVFSPLASSSTSITGKKSRKTTSRASQSSQDILGTARSAVTEKPARRLTKTTNKRAASHGPAAPDVKKSARRSKIASMSKQKVENSKDENGSDKNNDVDEAIADEETIDKQTGDLKRQMQRPIKSRRLQHVSSDSEINVDGEDVDHPDSRSAYQARDTKHARTDRFKALPVLDSQKSGETCSTRFLKPLKSSIHPDNSSTVLSKRSRPRAESDQDSEPSSKSQSRLLVRPQGGMDRNSARSESSYYTAAEAAADRTTANVASHLHSESHVRTLTVESTVANDFERAGSSSQSRKNPAIEAAENVMLFNAEYLPDASFTALPVVDRASPVEDEGRKKSQAEHQESDPTHAPTLTTAERAMTVEEWIRHEMGAQYENLRQDGEMRIQEFRKMAAQVRERIEAL